MAREATERTRRVGDRLVVAADVRLGANVRRIRVAFEGVDLGYLVDAEACRELSEDAPGTTGPVHDLATERG